MAIYTYNITDTKNDKLNTRSLKDEVFIGLNKNCTISNKGETFIIKFDEEVDNTILTTIVNDHTGDSSILDIIIQSYDAHKNYGITYYNRFRANLIIQVKQNILSMDDASHISLILKDVTNELVTGNWYDALHILHNISNDDIVTQDMLDNLISDFTDYINNNY